MCKWFDLVPHHVNTPNDVTTRSHDVTNESHVTAESHDLIIKYVHDPTSGLHGVTNGSYDVTTILTDHWMHSTPVQPHDRLIQVNFLPGRVYW